MDKKKKLTSTASHHASKKYSVPPPPDKEGMAPRLSQIYRHRASSHDVYDLGDDESTMDFTKNEFLAFKASFSRPKYANTYRMEPYRPFEAHVIRKKAEEILKNTLQDYKYDGSNAASKCSVLSEDILVAVKDQGFDRYKYIVQVFMVEKSGQSIHELFDLLKSFAEGEVMIGKDFTGIIDVDVGRFCVPQSLIKLIKGIQTSAKTK